MQSDGFFDKKVAASYDRIHGSDTSTSINQVVNILHDLAADGPALEFAIGTGRIALPLQSRGLLVKGIELSKAMVAELRKKESDAKIEVLIGNMTTTRFKETFSLVYLVFNTIDNLTTQEAQVACFQNAAAHLKPGGRFLVETLVPPIQKLPFGETLLSNACSTTHWGIDEFDISTQNYSSHHLYVQGNHAERLTVPFRYAWPAEMDLMARISGLEREHRWADWAKTPYTRHSTSHISVWKKPKD